MKVEQMKSKRRALLRVVAPHTGPPGAIDLFKLAKLDPKPTATA